MCVVSINIPEEVLLDLHEDEEDFIKNLGKNEISIFSFESEKEFIQGMVDKNIYISENLMKFCLELVNEEM